MSILVIAEHHHVALLPATHHTVTAALQCGSDVHVLVAGYTASAAAQAAACIQGVSQVWYACAAHLAQGLAETLSAQIIAIAANYSHILFAATAHGKNIAPRVAACLDVAQISDITAVVSADTFLRPIYAGVAIATVQSLDATHVLTVRPTAFAAATQTEHAQAVISPLTPVAPVGQTTHLGCTLPQTDRPDLSDARVVVSGGRGLGSSDKFMALLAPLADQLGAALGASRAAVDAGYAPNDWQVGQTGKIVAPQLYIAVGISGAIQHLAGMKDSKVIVAINQDPDAPIFAVADVGLKADLFTAVPELLTALQALSHS